MPALRASLLLVVATAALACGYPFERALEDAEVKGTLLRADGAPAATALASVPGTERVAGAGEDGVLSLKGFPAMRGVVRVIVDDDGDGVAEEGALLPFLTAFKEVKRNITDGVTTAPVAVVNGFLYGEVTLTETTTVSGEVLEEGMPLGAGRVARVLVFRAATLGDGESERVGTLPVEASGVALADGSFSIAGVLPGEVHVVALVGAAGDDPGRLGIASATAGDDDVALNASEPVPGEVFAVQIELVGATERASLEQVLFFRPNTTAPDLAVRDVGEPAGTHVIEAPRGVVDLQALVGADPSGLAFGLVIASDALAPFMPIELPGATDPCKNDAEKLDRDCDKDGIEGLPPIEASGADALYDACAAACTGLVGADLDGATCDGTDCDDDADGVADVDERACVGPLRGTDADGDSLCEPAADPFPLCAENTTADCL